MILLELGLGRLVDIVDVIDYINSSSQIICVHESPQTTRLTQLILSALQPRRVARAGIGPRSQAHGVCGNVGNPPDPS